MQYICIVVLFNRLPECLSISIVPVVFYSALQTMLLSALSILVSFPFFLFFYLNLLIFFVFCVCVCVYTFVFFVIRSYNVDNFVHSCV